MSVWTTEKDAQQCAAGNHTCVDPDSGWCILCGHDTDKDELMPAIMQFFTYAHLPERLQAISRPFGELAALVCELSDNIERDTALRKLLEAKDAAVRAFLFRAPV